MTWRRVVGEASSSRGYVIVLDENDETRKFTCDALTSAGYEAAGVGSTLGLRKALPAERSALLVCDVSPPLTYQQIVASVQAARAEIEDRLPIVLSGTQSASQLSILVRACRAAGFVERSSDPERLLRGLQRIVTGQRATLQPDVLDLPPASSRKRTADWAIIKLLLIDDSEITLQMMQARLREHGFDVRIAVSLGEVHSIIRGWSPNVIVADVNMPDMRGDDLCARLKTAAATRDAVIMLCSSMPEKELAAIADAVGADGCVSKSTGLDHFVRSVEAMCRRISNPIVSFQ